MSFYEAHLADFDRKFLDSKLSDFVIRCQGEEFRVHKFVLSARSPVFDAMFQSEMSESVKGEIRIDDADNDVFKEMLRYMYCAKVEDSFTKFKELLVAANKYQVEDLVKYCGTKVVESLNKDNALQIGVFAELHNAEDLMKECVKLILSNKPESLHQNWKDQVKGSPKMMQEIIQQLLNDTGTGSKVFEISRYYITYYITHGWTTGITSALAFKVDSKMQLCGIGIFGSNVDKENLAVDIKVRDDNNFIREEYKTFKSQGSYSLIQLLFTKPVPIEANKYHITAKNSVGKLYFGKNFKDIVEFEDVNANLVKLKVTFYPSHHDTYGYGQTGLFPALYFSKYY